MPRRKAPSDIEKEIKKERLRKHLDEVETLIREWLRQLSAPGPFEWRRGEWVLKSPYLPDIERDPERNHMLRKHLQSRTLWSHHTAWVGCSERVFHLVQSMVKSAQREKLEGATGRQYMPDFTYTALWQAFQMAIGRNADDFYKSNEQGRGVNFGAYPIESSQTTGPELVDKVAREHQALIDGLAKSEGMKELAKEWLKMTETQTAMRNLAQKELRSSGFLHPCSFCRPLWY